MGLGQSFTCPPGLEDLWLKTSGGGAGTGTLSSEDIGHCQAVVQLYGDNSALEERGPLPYSIQHCPELKSIDMIRVLIFLNSDNCCWPQIAPHLEQDSSVAMVTDGTCRKRGLLT